MLIKLSGYKSGEKIRKKFCKKRERILYRDQLKPQSTSFEHGKRCFSPFNSSHLSLGKQRRLLTPRRKKSKPKTFRPLFSHFDFQILCDVRYEIRKFPSPSFTQWPKLPWCLCSNDNFLIDSTCLTNGLRNFMLIWAKDK